MLETKHAWLRWAYTSEGNTVKMALTVMIIYCVLAFSHLIYLGISGQSSSAWDSAAEIVALAMNSTPMEHLKNTCAGIIGIRPFQTRVRILATASQAGEKGDHLELVFGERFEVTTQTTKMALDEEYGSFPSQKCGSCGHEAYAQGP